MAVNAAASAQIDITIIMMFAKAPISFEPAR